MGNRQGGPVVTPEAQLRESVNQIAINYILKAPFAELRALANYNTAQLNNYVFLTAELLNKTMSDREIEYIYNDIRGRPKIMSEPVIFLI
jgi:Holliday junction resolvasome RuvABC ATP-dependent DNA helicase subunit